MRRLKKIGVMVCVIGLLLTTCLPVFAAGEEYTYTIRFFAGRQGSFTSGEMMVFSDLHYGDRVNFYRSAVTLHDNSKYYIRGVRESGRDNSDSTADQTASFVVTGDRDYVIAYGILGDATSYTIHYEDENGRTLAPSETYYGNVGDRPVVAYLYIDGYRPQAYNLTRTLQKDPAENVFTFIYRRDTQTTEEETTEETGETPGPAPAVETEPPGETTTTTTDAAPADTGVAVIPGGAVPGGAGGGAAAADAAGAAPAGAGDLAEVPDEEVPQTDELVDLDDEDVPMAGLPDILNLASEARLLGIPVPVVAAIGAALLGSAWYVLVYKKRKKKEEQS